MTTLYLKLLCISCCLLLRDTSGLHEPLPETKLIPAGKFVFNSFVDCNMASVWIGDTFRIFPGKYGEDPLWGEAHELKFADGKNADETFAAGKEAFTNPVMPLNAKP